MNVQNRFSFAVNTPAGPHAPAWSLRTAEHEFTDPNGTVFFHSFALLSDDSYGTQPVILDELHFMPVIRRADGTRIRASARMRHLPQTLGAAAYRSPARNFDTLPNILYERGTPARMLRLWNQACRTALQIAALERPFNETYNCRAGTKTVIERLGYRFRTFAHPQMQRGLRSPLPREITPAEEPPFSLHPAADYEALRPLLALSRAEGLKPL